MTRPVRITTDASAELRDAVLCFEDRRAGLGTDFLAAVHDMIESIGQWPRSGSLVADVRPDVEARRMQIDRFQYYGAYIVGEDQALIIAIAHERRQPRYWIGRVG